MAYSLRTRSVAVAATRATRAAEQLDEYWSHLRLKDNELQGKHVLRLAQNADIASVQVAGATLQQATVKLSEAVVICLRL
ncbi:hypothetical protein [Oceanicola sp. 22II-s10i]|uniref:hypothetical protein n=1 Tax=Oceanicola sp. 22II-s10i TaxID=1317116 RepID=UPI0034E8F49E